MALKSSWAYREGKRTMRESLETIAKIEAEKKAKREAELPELCRKREIIRKVKETVFDDLRPGDTLAAFGMPQIVVKKKNRMSIITNHGNKLLKSEIL